MISGEEIQMGLQQDGQKQLGRVSVLSGNAAEMSTLVSQSSGRTPLPLKVLQIRLLAAATEVMFPTIPSSWVPLIICCSAIATNLAGMSERGSFAQIPLPLDLQLSFFSLFVGEYMAQRSSTVVVLSISGQVSKTLWQRVSSTQPFFTKHDWWQNLQQLGRGQK